MPVGFAVAASIAAIPATIVVAAVATSWAVTSPQKQGRFDLKLILAFVLFFFN
jgi:hypothetical protein